MSKSDVDVIQLFSNYSAGELDKPALIRQVRQKQLARNVAKGKTTGKMWWKVSNPANSFASIEVVADNAEEAIANAILPGNYPDWARVKNTLRATPVRPYTAPTAQSKQGSWGIWLDGAERFVRIPRSEDGGDGQALRRFDSESAARTWLNNYRDRNPGVRTDISIREIPADYQWPPADTAATAPAVNRNTLMPSGPGPWEVFRRSDGSSVAELGQTDRMSAEVEARRVIDQRREAPELYGVRTVTTNNTDNWSADFERRMQAGTVPRSSYELFLKSNGRVVTAPNGNPIVFQATDPDDAANKIARYVADFNLPGDPTNYDVRSVLQPAQQDAAQGGTVDVAGEQPAAPQAQQEWTGAWLVLDPNGRVLQRFTGIGNAQADANRHAMNWLLSNPRHMQAGVTVAPEMQ